MNQYKILSLLLSFALLIAIWKLTFNHPTNCKPVEKIATGKTKYTPSTKVDLSNAKLSLAVKPVVVVGSYDNKGQPNIMTASWVGIVNSNPPMVAVSIRPSRHSFQNVNETGAFTLNIPHKDQWHAADYAGTHSGRDKDKMKHLNLSAEKATAINAPFIKEFPLNIGCRVVKKIELGSHIQFIGEITEVKASDNILTKNENIDMEKLQPFILGEDQYYWSIGSKIERAFSTKREE